MNTPQGKTETDSPSSTSVKNIGVLLILKDRLVDKPSYDILGNLNSIKVGF